MRTEIGAAVEGAADQAGEPVDKGRPDAQSRHADIISDACFLGQVAIFDIEFYQGLGVLGHEGDRHHNHGNALSAGAPQLFISGGADPIQRPDPALITDRPVEIRIGRRQRPGDGCRRASVLAV